VIEHRRQDIVVIQKDDKAALLIDIAVLGDTKGKLTGRKEGAASR